MAKQTYEKPVLVSSEPVEVAAAVPVEQESPVKGVSLKQWNDPQYLVPPRYIVLSVPEGIDWGALPRVAAGRSGPLECFGGEAGLAALHARGVKTERASFASIAALRQARAAAKAAAKP